MISGRNRRHGRAITSVFLVLSLFLIHDSTTARQPHAIEDTVLPGGKSPDDGGVYNQYARFMAGIDRKSTRLNSSHRT